MHKLNPYYVVGLVDGEGSFTVYVRHPDNITHPKRRVRIEPKFFLKLIEKDKEILYSLQNFFGCGKVYFQKDNRPNHQHCYRYEVHNRSELSSIIIPFFKRYVPLLSSKRKDFEIFSQVMEMIEAKIHMNESGLKKLFELTRAMH